MVNEATYKNNRGSPGNTSGLNALQVHFAFFMQRLPPSPHRGIGHTRLKLFKGPRKFTTYKVSFHLLSHIL